MIYILDSNIFISSKNTAFNPIFHPGYWDFLDKGFENKKIILLDTVYEELTKGDDSLSEWIKKKRKYVFSAKTNEEIQKKLVEVSNFVSTNQQWKGKDKQFLSHRELLLFFCKNRRQLK